MYKENTAAKLIREGIIGRDTTFSGPFGEKRIVYTDWTASGKPLLQVENYIKETILPLYANTHTESSVTGAATTAARERARESILRAVHGESTDAVMFTGSGSTAAINHFVKLIELDEKCAKSKSTDRPLVLVSGCEHHSNLLPWRECGAEVIEVLESETTGAVCLDHIRSILELNRSRSCIIGSFSAGSNVTGVCCDVKAIAILLHQYGALACFDYACAGPYLDICMNWKPEDSKYTELSYLDAVYVSCHKFVGGVGATGVLIAKKNILTRWIPVSPGGGTVSYVTSASQVYLDDVVHRVEAGTPDILGSIRAGLVFEVKSLFGIDKIKLREGVIQEKLCSALSSNPNFVMLGPPVSLEGAHRLPIVSFVIKCGDKYLHHNFVSSVFNDLYGIQIRSGCMCAGPYAIRLLGLDMIKTAPLAGQLHDAPYLKWGFCRLSLVYFNSDEDIEYVIKALLDVADNAWKLLPQYEFDPQSSNWSHHYARGVQPTVPSFKLDGAHDELQRHAIQISISDAQSDKKYYDSTLAEAMRVYESSYALYNDDGAFSVDSVTDFDSELYSKGLKQFSWFLFPKEVHTSARSQKEAEWVCPIHINDDNPLHPEKYWPTVLAETKQGAHEVVNPPRSKNTRTPPIRKFFDWSRLFCHAADTKRVHNPTGSSKTPQ